MWAALNCGCGVLSPCFRMTVFGLITSALSFCTSFENGFEMDRNFEYICFFPEINHLMSECEKKLSFRSTIVLQWSLCCLCLTTFWPLPMKRLLVSLLNWLYISICVQLQVLIYSIRAQDTQWCNSILNLLQRYILWSEFNYMLLNVVSSQAQLFLIGKRQRQIFFCITEVWLGVDLF